MSGPRFNRLTDIDIDIKFICYEAFVITYPIFSFIIKDLTSKSRPISIFSIY